MPEEVGCEPAAVFAGDDADLPASHTNFDVDADITHVYSQKRQRGLVVTIDVRAACEAANAEADSLRAQLMAAWKANAALKRERTALETEARSQARKLDRSEFVLSQARKWHQEADSASTAQSEVKGARACYRAAKENLDSEQKLRREAEAECSKIRTDIVKLRADIAKHAAQESTAAATASRLVHAQASLATSARKLSSAESEVKELRRAKDTLQSEFDEAKVMYQTSTEQLGEYAKINTFLQAELAAVQAEYDEVKQAGRNVGGRPRGHAGREAMEARWEQMTGGARRVALCRHTCDIRNALLDAGVDDWTPSCFALVIKSLGMLDELMRTKTLAQTRLDFVQSLRAILEAEWGVDLALFVRGELNISDSDYDKLRLAFCKRYDQGKSHWVKRAWYTCPVLGKTVAMPEPLVSRYKWQPAWRKYVETHGLSLSADGKVCERSLLECARKLIHWDREILTDPSDGRWMLTFGIDASAISSKRHSTHNDTFY